VHISTMRTVRVLPHIKRLDDFLGDFLVRVTCPCWTSRHIEPEALAQISGRSARFAALAERMRCSQCGKKVAEVVAVARPRPRGAPITIPGPSLRSMAIPRPSDIGRLRGASTAW
jgi:hypothetical protein